MQAHLLSLNDFSKPKVLDKTDAGYINIIYLILLTKGKYQSHPTMGVGIRERYRYNDDENFLMGLREDIKSQIEQFLPELGMTDISVGMNNHTLGIVIDTVNGSYALAYDTKKETMEAGASYVLKDL